MIIRVSVALRKNGKIHFLVCFVPHDNNNNKLRSTIYRKATHADRLLDQSSYNSISHKATTIQTLTRRARLICGSPDSFADENKYLHNVFNNNNNNNNHSKDIFRRNTCKNTEPNVTNNDATPGTTTPIPYMKGTSETIARILQSYNILVAHKPITTLQQLLTNVKGRDELSHRQGAVYKIKSCDCQATYSGETGRNLDMYLYE